MTPETQVAVIVAVAVIIITFAIAGWRRAKSKRIATERARRDGLLGSASALRPGDDLRMRNLGKAQLSLSFVGTYAARMAVGVLTILERAGCEAFVGPIFLNEPDVDSREICLAEMPGVFRARVVAGHYPVLGGGGGGKSVAEMKEHREYWERDNAKATTAWLQAIDRRKAEVHVGPVLHVAFVSPGASLALAEHPIGRYHEQHPTVPTYISTILDQKRPIRERFDEVHTLLDPEQTRTRGTLVFDNALRQQANDFGSIQFLAAMTAGTWLTTKQLSGLNGLAYVFEQRGGIGALSVHVETLPVFHLPAFEKSLPQIYYTDRTMVIDRAIAAIKKVLEDESIQSLPVQRVGKGNVRVICVIAPVEPDAFRSDIEEIEERIGPYLHGIDPNICLQFASIGQPLTPGGTALISAVMVQRVEATRQEIEQLARGETVVDEKFLPVAYRNGTGVKQVLADRTARNGGS